MASLEARCVGVEIDTDGLDTLDTVESEWLGCSSAPAYIAGCALYRGEYTACRPCDFDN